MSDVLKSYEYYWNETEEARKDPFLVDVVRTAWSVESANAAAEACDYPTNLCRQIRLLYQFRNHAEWQISNGWREIFDLSKPSGAGAALIHTYPCEWDIEWYHGVIKGIYSGQLVVTKNACKAALLWDYTLLDEDGEEVAHSRDLGRDTFLREGLIQVNCQLNCGSVLLPRTGTKVTFSALVNTLRITRVKSPIVMEWQRFLAYGKKELPCIRRSVRGEGRSEKKQVVHMMPLSQEELSMTNLIHAGLGDAWGVFITTSFLKRSSRNFPPDNAPVAVLFHVMSGYAFCLKSLTDYMNRGGKAFDAQRFFRSRNSGGDRRGTWDVWNQVIAREDQSSMEETFKSVEGNVEDILLDLEASMPRKINCLATIEQVCDIRKDSSAVFDIKHGDFLRHSGLFVKA